MALLASQASLYPVDKKRRGRGRTRGRAWFRQEAVERLGGAAPLGTQRMDRRAQQAALGRGEGLHEHLNVFRARRLTFTFQQPSHGNFKFPSQFRDALKLGNGLVPLPLRDGLVSDLKPLRHLCLRRLGEQPLASRLDAFSQRHINSIKHRLRGAMKQRLTLE